MTRLQAIAPAVCAVAAFHGWVGFVWYFAGWEAAMASAATLIAAGAWCIAAGPLVSGLSRDRAAGRGEGL